MAPHGWLLRREPVPVLLPSLGQLTHTQRAAQKWASAGVSLGQSSGPCKALTSASAQGMARRACPGPDHIQRRPPVAPHHTGRPAVICLAELELSIYGEPYFDTD